jgi:predicted GIY-YIG superfamily endonuclease
VTGTPERTAVYRIRGEADLLLYIGMTNSIPLRWNHHMRYQPWWDELRSLTIEFYDTREEAAAAEKAAILGELPKYNKTYLLPSRPGPKLKPKAVPAQVARPAPPPSILRCGSRWSGPMLTPEEAAEFLGITEEELSELVDSDLDLPLYDFDAPDGIHFIRFFPNELRAYAAFLPEDCAA